MSHRPRREVCRPCERNRGARAEIARLHRRLGHHASGARFTLHRSVGLARQQMDLYTTDPSTPPESSEAEGDGTRRSNVRGGFAISGQRLHLGGQKTCAKTVDKVFASSATATVARYWASALQSGGLGGSGRAAMLRRNAANALKRPRPLFADAARFSGKPSWRGLHGA